MNNVVDINRARAAKAKPVKAATPKRKGGAMPAKAALAHLRKIAIDDIVEAASVSDLGAMVGWTQKHMSSQIGKWRDAGKLVREDVDGKVRLRLLPDQEGKRTGASRATALPRVPKRVTRRAPKQASEQHDLGPQNRSSGHPKTHPPQDARMDAGPSIPKDTTSQITTEKSDTYANQPSAAIPPPETSKTGPQKPPAIEPPKEVPGRANEDAKMGFFSPKKAAETEAETPPDQTAGAQQGGQPLQPPAAPYGGYGHPVTVLYPSAPTVHAEPPDWRLQPHAGGGGVSVPIDGTPTPATWSDRPRIGWLTLLAALGMASISTILTVMGFAVLLPRLPALSIAIGCATEFGRLVITGTTKYRWYELSRLMIFAAFVYIALAEGVSLVGVYSELHNLHTGDRPMNAAAAEQGKAEATAQVTYQQGVIADLDRQISALDRDSSALIGAGAQKGGRRDRREGKELMTSSSRQLAQLSEQRKQAAAKLASFQTEAARATGKAAVIDAEIGSVRQVAALLHIGAGEALRWWLLAITVLIGPAASLMIAMAIPARGRTR